MTKLAFVDTETTGLDPDLHEIYEVGLIVREDETDTEYHWWLPVDIGRADARALAVGRYYERHPMARESWSSGDVSEPHTFARLFSRLTAGAHLVGAVVSFDEERLRKLLRSNGGCPDWHYHLIDVEALTVGHLAARGIGYPLTLPWDSKMLTRWMDLDPDSYDVHTAMGDARWAQDLYDAVMTDKP